MIFYPKQGRSRLVNSARAHLLLKHEDLVVDDLQRVVVGHTQVGHVVLILVAAWLSEPWHMRGMSTRGLRDLCNLLLVFYCEKLEQEQIFSDV